MSGSVSLGGDPEALGMLPPLENPFAGAAPGTVSIGADQLSFGRDAVISGAAPIIDTLSRPAIAIVPKILRILAFLG